VQPSHSRDGCVTQCARLYSGQSRRLTGSLQRRSPSSSTTLRAPPTSRLATRRVTSNSHEPSLPYVASRNRRCGPKKMAHRHPHAPKRTLEVRRGDHAVDRRIAPSPALPIELHVAEKVHAYSRVYGVGSLRSTCQKVWSTCQTVSGFEPFRPDLRSAGWSPANASRSLIEATSASAIELTAAARQSSATPSEESETVRRRTDRSATIRCGRGFRPITRAPGPGTVGLGRRFAGRLRCRGRILGWLRWRRCDQAMPGMTSRDESTTG
jgi:hypothetical protein